MKHDTFDKYPPGSLDLTQRALLTIWDCLADYRADLVLVGGLAVRHLTRRANWGLPDAVTIDVDLGISIAASNGIYGSIRQTLSAHDFRWAGQRFVRKVSGQGPISCAAFRMNNEHLLPAREDESLRIRQQCVTLAHALLG